MQGCTEKYVPFAERDTYAPVPFGERDVLLTSTLHKLFKEPIGGTKTAYVSLTRTYLPRHDDCLKHHHTQYELRNTPLYRTSAISFVCTPEAVSRR